MLPERSEESHTNSLSGVRHLIKTGSGATDQAEIDIKWVSCRTGLSIFNPGRFTVLNRSYKIRHFSTPEAENINVESELVSFPNHCFLHRHQKFYCR